MSHAIQKLYGADPEPQKGYSPGKCIGIDVNTVMGDPAPRLVSTSYGSN